jgi:hypothetical protein
MFILAKTMVWIIQILLLQYQIYTVFFILLVFGIFNEKFLRFFVDIPRGFAVPRRKEVVSKAPAAPADPRSNEQKKKDKEAADKKKEEDFKKLRDFLWVVSSIAGAVIMTWVIIKHWND